MHPYRHRFTDDISLRDLAPHTTVATIVAVVAHHKVVTGLHDNGKVARSPAIIDLHQITVGSGQGLPAHLDRISTTRELRQPLLRHRLPVHQQLLVPVSDSVTRNADDPLDVIRVVLMRWKKNHDIASLRLTDVQNLGACHRQPKTIRKLVHQNVVAHLEGRHH